MRREGWEYFQRKGLASCEQVLMWRRSLRARSASRQRRWTRSLRMPGAWASLRQDQRVEPSAGRRRVALRIFARRRAVSLQGGCPGRWVSSPSVPVQPEMERERP